MPRILGSLPDPPRSHKDGLRTHQIRVLRAIGTTRGPSGPGSGGLSRTSIAKKVGITSTVVSRALGYEDKEKRSSFEANDPCGGYPSLLTLKLVKGLVIDLDGHSETIYLLTSAGKQALRETRNVHLPPPRD